MKAIVQDQYGPATVLAAHEIDAPTIDDDQVLIRVRAAGVNPADWAIMCGLPYIARPVYGLPRPRRRVRGTDVAGVVEAVGRHVTQFQPGDEVFGRADGSYAQLAAAAPGTLARKPAGLSFEQAAAAPMAGLVALQAMRDHAHVGPGDQVLINGASGGIGTFAVQIAKALGAEVTAVCSTRNVDLVRSLGADHVIDYTTDDFTAQAERYDVILDNVSNHSLTDLRRVLAPTGTLVPNGGRFDNRWFASTGRLIVAAVRFVFGSQKVATFVVAITTPDLIALADLIEAGAVTPVIDRTYPLTETDRALTQVGDGHARGKIVITV
ncbi:NAD(P)-dependent alcohol dehydrogenase [Pengzhenrongella phosphoraccumulans]|uniref:NAD(P)-dependent alcohol dehydrogenase n=1 Tax=Pengzhenrongella phosphoraccumulans TaxID=3114394 RepID=UPI00388E7745